MFNINRTKFSICEGICLLDLTSDHLFLNERLAELRRNSLMQEVVKCESFVENEEENFVKNIVKCKSAALKAALKEIKDA